MTNAAEEEDLVVDTAGSNIKDVWDGNLEEEISQIILLLDDYPYLAMDTEFPGFCINNPDVSQKDSAYRFIKANVDALKVIQIGITLSDKDGNFPEPICTWQFNLKFDLKTDRFSASSIELLKNAGINFNNLLEFGIEPIRLAELFTSSGLLFNEDVYWVTFHGAFDFAYLMKLLSNQNLQSSLDSFNITMKLYFPNSLDLKVISNDIYEKRNGS
jgi:CCR4-NOT transcription complex subunit 7/8